MLSGTLTCTLRNLDSTDRLAADAQLNLRATGNNGKVSGKLAYDMRGETYKAALTLWKTDCGGGQIIATTPSAIKKYDKD